MEKTDTIILSPEELAAYMAESTISVTSTYELGNVAENVCQFLNAVKEKNKIPSNPKSEEE